MTSRGTVRVWHDEHGWGVLDADDTPGGCWAHFSSVAVSGIRRLEAGQLVEFRFETGEQDGFAYRALEVWPTGGAPYRTKPRGPSPAYRSLLALDPDVAPRAVSVRRLRHADVVGVQAGDDDLVLYRVRDHAGEVTLDRSHVVAVGVEPVVDPRRAAVLGTRTVLTVRSVYGGPGVEVVLHSTDEARDAEAPVDEVEVYVEDAEGPVTLPVTPDWGAQVELSVLVPGIGPDALVTAVVEALDERFPGHRVLEVQARPAADRYVQVHRPDHPAHPPAASVLEAEAHTYPSVFGVEAVRSAEAEPPR